ncbi:MAG: cysteine desulfurase NifS [Deltaproteobacteria bacterium]|nr:cysteine desulfurase NifS [Deltaproteobacteria bacterium]MDX2496877.1 cysteine desulfurase NifS [Desulfobacterales bacterium]MBW1826241.1 cysteine desulfurase NifS [Deltaproteobacteria bacterium]MBW1970362.1 cysteine desulfurase NifS [Deltaproteobacteria bacterium]MBW2156289.1 cysteine desulfurase NifS [Deltaproteobacteria bacterium]
MNEIYVDNNATTQVSPEVLEEMLPYFNEFYGNPSSMHTFGGKVEHKITEARARIASLLGASPEEIIFTSCGTESDSTAIRSVILSNPDKKHILTSRVEHPAVKNLYEYLSKNGYRVTFVPVDRKGRLDLDYLYENLSDDTALISIMWANNESGVIFPIEEISKVVREKGIVFHTDAVQAVGKFPIDLKAIDIDMLSLSGHKLHGPKGVGALYVRRGTKYTPFMIGGHQEKGRRGGTENVASIIGLGKACELAAAYLSDNNNQVKQLRDKLENEILKRVPNTIINGDRNHRLPNTTSIAFEYVEGESILLMMDEFGICASSGSACTSGSLEPSHVLRAMGVPFTAAHGSVRFSLSKYNTEEEIDFIIEKLPPIIERLRELSPFWKKIK